jgi:AraC family transcriptional regulator, arabinose operon regulatory protein
MTARIVTREPVVNPIVTGQFTERLPYSNWRPNGTRDFLLILTLGGSGRFGYPQGEIVTEPGDLVILCPGTPHDYQTTRGVGEWHLLWAHFLPRPYWQEWIIGFPEVAPGIVSLRLGVDTSARTAVEDALVRMNRYANGGLLRRDEFAMNALEEALLQSDLANPLAVPRAKFDERIVKVMELLRGELLSEPFVMEQLAARVHLSPSRLAHLFKKQTGRTPGQFHEQERLLRAQHLLTLTNRSIASISEEVGFASPFYFTLRFKKHTGKSPRDFRQSSLLSS